MTGLILAVWLVTASIPIHAIQYIELPGWVSAFPDKIRAAKRERYHPVLVPRGQLHTPQWNLVELGFQLNIMVREVDTIDDAYLLMTGKSL